MKAKFKKVISIMLSVLLIATSLPLSALSVSADDSSETIDFYCAPGEKQSGNNTVFSTTQKAKIDYCEYTFNGTSTESSASGTFSNSKSGTTEYLNINTNSVGCVNSTTAETISVTKNESVVKDTFLFGAPNQNNSTSYLYFWDDSTTTPLHRFDRTTNNNEARVMFALFTKDETCTDSGIKGYKRVTSFDEIKSGQSYLIAHPTQFNTDGTAKENSDWYLLYPSTSASTNYTHVAKICETTISHTTESYCGRGTGLSNDTVVFPEEGQRSLTYAEFTFNGSNATGTFTNTVLGYTVYLNLATAKRPVRTMTETVKITADTASSAGYTFNIHGETSNTYLYFHDDTDGSKYYYNRNSATSSTRTAFAFFVKDEGNTSSGIYGYKRVTSLDEITDGKKYLIAHAGAYNNDGTAKKGSSWYIMYPSKLDSEIYLCVAKVYNTINKVRAKRIQNGSFEKNASGGTMDIGSGTHKITPANNVEAWDTTAKEYQIELFKAGSTAHMKATDSAKNYIPDGTLAAELNADEAGSLFQVVNTIPSSTYLWGLDHRGRNGTDTMALVIGPNQKSLPSKSIVTSDSGSDLTKTQGKDQFMQMVEWAKAQGSIKLLTDYPSKEDRNSTIPEGYDRLQCITVYSKPFSANGTFETTDDLSPFSLVPTDEHTEEWHIWIMISGSGDWSSYGANDSTVNKGQNIVNEYGNIYNYTVADEELKKYFYNVPAGQTESLFAFVPIDTAQQHINKNSDGTCGNLLDNVNFEVFNALTASSTDHGTGSVSNTNKGENFSGNDDISKTNSISIYTHDNSTQNLIAKISKENLENDVSFAGVYLTTQDENGQSTTVFKPRQDFEVDESTLNWQSTDDENTSTATTTLKSGKEVTITRTKNDKGEYSYDIPSDVWLKMTNSQNGVAYIYQMKNVTYAVDAHFVFLKSPTVTYDSNCGKDNQYVVGNGNDTNIYSFKPDDSQTGTIKYIDPVTSHEPTPPDESTWKFIGWEVFDDDGAVLGSDGKQLVLSGTNAIACNTYNPNEQNSKRTFIIVDGATKEETFDDGEETYENGEHVGKKWTVKDGKTAVYEKESEALSLIAQWRYKETFAPQYIESLTDTEYKDGETGGTITLDGIETSDENYTDNGNGSKSYFAKLEERIVAKAKANPLYTFIGWYDENGNVLTTNSELIVNQAKGETGKYYAKFQKTGVAVNFYFGEYNNQTNSYDYTMYDGGKFTQYLDKGSLATPPSGDSESVKTWYTSPTERGADSAFDFTKTLTKSIDLYAGKAFTFNYFNRFQFTEPWKLETFSTLKYDGQYVDMFNNSEVTDYKIYILKGDQPGESAPTATQIKENSATQTITKDSGDIIFDKTTATGKAFNRIGTLYDKFYLFNMKTPVWVTFEFKYRGIVYTANVKDRCLYNNIETYMKTSKGSNMYTDYEKEQQEALFTSILNMYDKVKDLGISKPTEYAYGDKVSGLEYSESATALYVTSETAIRNIEPWGFKYSFSLNSGSFDSYSDYGAVVLTDDDGSYSNITVSDMLSNKNAVMYSKSNGKISDGENGAKIVYHTGNIKISNYDKNTYVVFFAKDADGYHYSNIVSNSYKQVATAENSEISKSILDYAEHAAAYWNEINPSDEKSNK